MAKCFGFTSLTGGGTGALDAIDGSVITVGDIAIGANSTDNYTYICDGSGDAESSPDTIAPDTNAGVKRWKRRHDESKAYRASAPTNGHMASLDADGDLVDSGKVASDVIEKSGSLTANEIVRVDSSGKLVSAGLSRFNENVLINGSFNVWQEAASFTGATTPNNNDDRYIADQWILLSDGNDIVDVSRDTEVPTTGFKRSIALDVETINKKFGILQLIENKNMYLINGKTVVFSFYAKASSIAKLSNIKAGIVSWDGVADTVTSDIVDSWGAGGTTPTLVANWTFENTPANLGITTSWARYYVTAAIDTADVKNVGVFIWSDVVDTTAGHFLYITGAQLEVGTIPSDFQYRHFATELALCQRYYEKSFDYATQPVQSSGTNVGGFRFPQVVAASTSQNLGQIRFATPKMTTPSITLYNPAAANGEVRNVGTGSDCSSTAITNEAECGFVVTTTTPGGSAAGQGLVVQWKALARL